MSVVKVGQARDHLEVIGTSQDVKIAMMIKAAEAHVSQYLDRTLEPWDADDEEVPVPEDVKHAILLLVGDFFNIREASVVGTIHAENPAVKALLSFHRTGFGI